MEVVLRYFDGCPNWQTTLERLRSVLRDAGLDDVQPVLERVDTPEDAERLRFVGSPTILIDGLDPFDDADDTSYGLACRVYLTPEGPVGSPTTEQLAEAIRRR